MVATATRRKKAAQRLAEATGTPAYEGTPHAELDQALAQAIGLTADGIHPAERVAATRYDPLVFALVYLEHHLRAPTTDDLVTLSEFHLGVVRWAVPTLVGKPVRLREDRDAFVAPRESGKSTWLYLVIPLWAGAHGHTRFTAAFANTATQARDHLTTLRLELQTNELLQVDYPEMCTPAMRASPRRPISDRDDDIHQNNGWRMVVRGADKAALGLKKGADRPDFILLDDIEPDESNYSPHKMRGRLLTILDAILPMNLAARVVLTGTVTMPGSIVHQLLEHHLGTTPEDEADDRAWIDDENWRVHYQPPIITDKAGGERSWWPEKWPLHLLQAMRHTRSYRKNMENLPLAGDGLYWTGEHFTYDALDGYGRTVLYIDPAVTTHATSDYTGLSVVSLSPVKGDLDPDTGKPRKRLWVRYSTHVRLVGQRLKNRVSAILGEYQDIGAIVAETNNGGDYLLDALADLGVPVIPDPATEAKTVRAQRALDLYDLGKVIHTTRHTILESEMEAFGTAGVHDDTLDSAVGGILFLVRKRPPKRAYSGSQL